MSSSGNYCTRKWCDKIKNYVSNEKKSYSVKYCTTTIPRIRLLSTNFISWSENFLIKLQSFLAWPPQLFHEIFKSWFISFAILQSPVKPYYFSYFFKMYPIIHPQVLNTCYNCFHTGFTLCRVATIWIFIQLS